MARNLEKSVSMAVLFVEEEEEEEEFELLGFSEDEYNNGVLGQSLSQWEFINVSESEGEDEPEQQQESHKDGSESDSTEEAPHKTPHFIDHDYTDHHHGHRDDDDDDDADDDDFDDTSDLNDDLVPWSVSDKLGRQRMRKSGKRGFQKIHRQSAKKSPYLAKRPGVFRGKHGLG